MNINESYDDNGEPLCRLPEDAGKPSSAHIGAGMTQEEITFLGRINQTETQFELDEVQTSLLMLYGVGVFKDVQLDTLDAAIRSRRMLLSVLSASEEDLKL